MKKIIIILGLLVSSTATFAQGRKANNADNLLKDSIYNANKTKVLNYSMGDFEKLFFEFNDKKFDQNILLTKEQFYTYTVKIATFSDRLAALYPQEEEVAAESKKKWLSESFEDYLLSKQTRKK
jgi:3-methyladenine DNA glycosylase Tag